LPQICAVLYDIDDLRHEIDQLDAEILAAVKRRTEVSQAPRALALHSPRLRGGLDFLALQRGRDDWVKLTPTFTTRGIR
jgi:hypothetical protein